jgi:hypothetical protein
MISGIYKISDTSNVSRNKCSDDDLNCILMFESKPTTAKVLLEHLFTMCQSRVLVSFTSSLVYSLLTLYRTCFQPFILLCYSQFSSVPLSIMWEWPTECLSPVQWPSVATRHGGHGPSLDLHSVIEQEQDLTRNQAAAIQCAVTMATLCCSVVDAWRIAALFGSFPRTNNCSCGNQGQQHSYYPPVVVAVHLLTLSAKKMGGSNEIKAVV